MTARPAACRLGPFLGHEIRLGPFGEEPEALHRAGCDCSQGGETPKIFNRVARRVAGSKVECAAGRRSHRRIAAGPRALGKWTRPTPRLKRGFKIRGLLGIVRFLLGNYLDPTRRHHLPDSPQELGLHNSGIVSLVDRGGEPVNEGLELHTTPTLSAQAAPQPVVECVGPSAVADRRRKLRTGGRMRFKHKLARSGPFLGFFHLPGCVRG